MAKCDRECETCQYHMKCKSDVSLEAINERMKAPHSIQNFHEMVDGKKGFYESGYLMTRVGRFKSDGHPKGQTFAQEQYFKREDK